MYWIWGGTRWRSWLRHCATRRKVAGSIPMVSLEFFIDKILPVAPCISLYEYTFAQRRNRLTTHFSGRIPVVKRRLTVMYLFLYDEVLLKSPSNPSWRTTPFWLSETIYSIHSQLPPHICSPSPPSANQEDVTPCIGGPTGRGVQHGMRAHSSYAISVFLLWLQQK